jgi:hypothetical protein
MIATERSEMALSEFLKSLQTPRHKGRLRPATNPLKPKPGLNGPPAVPFVLLGPVLLGSEGVAGQREDGVAGLLLLQASLDQPPKVQRIPIL